MAASGEWSQALTSYLAFSTGTRIPSVDARIIVHEIVYAAETVYPFARKSFGSRDERAKLRTFSCFFSPLFLKLFSSTVAEQSWHFDVHADNDSLCAQQRYFNIFPLSLIKTKPKFLKKIYRFTLFTLDVALVFNRLWHVSRAERFCNICLKTFTQHFDISII